MTTAGLVRGAFAGLATLDVINLVERLPDADQKVTAVAQFVAAGGPATNAAVTFTALGGQALLLTSTGSGAIGRIIADELTSLGVEVVDVAPGMPHDAPVSSVTLVKGSSSRSVIGSDAAAVSVPAPDPSLIAGALEGCDVALLDGHHPDLARGFAHQVSGNRIPTVLDAGRWKPVMADVVDHVSDVVASADFRLPGTSDSHRMARQLASGARNVVVTAGEHPVRWWDGQSQGEVEVPEVSAVDTLGAGDVFHGAYAFALAHGAPLVERIEFASRVAATRCQVLGPRTWLGRIRELGAAFSQR